ncbi:hypothetical protein OHR86_27955 [Streptomyces sp. NBC_00441]|uniref:hypothetical protein n=1 Tax=Streptomyces sp. NBC_00441 TaxID=2975742 RepID=UPI002E2D5821|nr:hypothetical protein [Streptomyces sp. NBC_00441]
MTDNCPQCPQEGVAPAAEDHRNNQVSHLYRCAGCGHIWSTNRDLGVYGYDDREAA